MFVYINIMYLYDKINHIFSKLFWKSGKNSLDLLQVQPILSNRETPRNGEDKRRGTFNIY